MSIPGFCSFDVYNCKAQESLCDDDQVAKAEGQKEMYISSQWSDFSSLIQ